MEIKIVEGDLLKQQTDVIVNPWNRNIIPWWLLIPQGVSGAIKKQAGNRPFKEIAKCGSMALGEARISGAGKLDFKAIIHVAGINMFWVSTEYSITRSVVNAIKLAEKKGYKSIAFPLIGSGVGSKGQDKSLILIQKALNEVNSNIKVIVVKFKK